MLNQITKTTVLLAWLLTTSAAHAEPFNEPVYIDVRTWLEHQIDHVDGDLRIHASEILAGVSQAYPDKATPIHLYCAVGGRAARAADALRRAGYSNVHNAGGIDDVRKARFTQTK